MAYKNKKDRDYRSEYDNYQGTEEQKKRRARRNAIRATLAKKGRVHKGDGKDVDHKDNNPKNNSPKNVRVQTASNNRSFKRNPDGSVNKTAKKKTTKGA